MEVEFWDFPLKPFESGEVYGSKNLSSQAPEFKLLIIRGAHYKGVFFDQGSVNNGIIMGIDFLVDFTV